MPTTPAAAPAAPATALGQLVWGAPLHASEGADFKKHTWSFRLDPGQKVSAGRFVILPEAAVRAALERDSDAAMLVIPEGGRRHLRCHDSCSLRLSIEEETGDEYVRGRTLFDVTLYRDHTRLDTDMYWHPAIWWGSESRLDANGETWSRRLHMVQDDFGYLVQVERRQ